MGNGGAEERGGGDGGAGRGSPASAEKGRLWQGRGGDSGGL
jgi:hypothetical protein